MKSSIFTKRILSGIIDYIIVFIVSYGVCAVLIGRNIITINIQMAPFVIMKMLIYPLPFLISVIRNSKAYGNIFPIITVFLTALIIELLYFSLFEILSHGKTIGKSVLRIRLSQNNNSSFAMMIIIRNILKIISIYLFFIPFLLSYFSKNSTTIYDKLSGFNTVTD